MIKNRLHRLLRFTERYTKTDMVYLASNGFWLTLGQVIATILALGLSVVLANVIPKEVYGSYKFILSVTGVLAALSLSGMGTVITQAVARGAEGTLKLAMRTHLKWGGVVFIASLAASLYYLANDNTTLAWSFLAASILIPLTGAFGLYGSFLSGRKNFKANTTYWSIGQVFHVGLIAIAAFFTNSVFILVATYFSTQALSAIFFYFYATRKHQPNDVEDNSMLNYGKHISLVNLFGTFASHLDKIVVFHFLGAIELAVFAFAVAIPEQLKGSYKNLFNIALPKFAELDEPSMRRSIKSKIYRLTAVTVGLVVVYYFLAPFVYQILFPQYLESINLSRLYILGIIAVPGLALFGTYFQLEKATGVIYKLGIIGNSVIVALTFLGVIYFGLVGVILAKSASWFIMLGVNVYYFRRRT